MPRTIFDVPPTPVATPASGRCYDVELITPMVGGGATAGVIDLDFPIRPTSIRGHLRHWWRLVRGFALGDGMWQREEEIFGSTEFPSPMTVSVEALTERKDRGIVPIQNITPTSTRGYILFPSIDKGHDLLASGYKFRLRVATCDEHELVRRRAGQNRRRKPTQQLPTVIPDIADDVHLAIRAWLLFGGIGARTRRGCGSLRLVIESVPSPALTAKQMLGIMPAGFRMFQARSQKGHLDAWDDGSKLLKDFRQSVPARRGEARKKFTEAETLRRMTGRRSRRARKYTEEEMPSGFPRAELGLPIIFQFKDSEDPQQMIVLPTGRDGAGKALQRMCSPVLLRPIPVSATHSLATILLIGRPNQLTVDVAPADDQQNGRRPSSLPVVAPQLATYHNSPLAGSPAGSAIEAFLKYAEGNGFTEVTR